jgi:hypothetical protein
MKTIFSIAAAFALTAFAPTLTEIGSASHGRHLMLAEASGPSPGSHDTALYAEANGPSRGSHDTALYAEANGPTPGSHDTSLYAEGESSGPTRGSHDSAQG